MSRRRNGHDPQARLEAAVANAGAGRVPLGVNVQLYTQRVPPTVGPDGVVMPGGLVQVLQLADETRTLVVRYGLPDHIRRALAEQLAAPLEDPGGDDQADPVEAGDGEEA